LLGVKVWIFKKEFFRKTEKEMLDEARLIEKPEEVEIKEEKPPVEEIVKEEEEDNVITEEGKI